MVEQQEQLFTLEVAVVELLLLEQEVILLLEVLELQLVFQDHLLLMAVVEEVDLIVVQEHL